MILVTGSTGKTGQAVIRALVRRNESVRALSHKQRHTAILRKIGAHEITLGDMRSLEKMQQACDGVDAIYHICPNVSPNEIEIGKIMIQAAQSARVSHFVYHSVFHPHIEAMPHHWQKMRVEEMLFASGLNYTILQPAPYMQNILAYWQNIMTQNSFVLPYAKKTRMSLVDLEDVAEAAAIVLSANDHFGAIYELCSAECFSQSEIAEILSCLLERKITVKEQSVETWATNARKQGLGEYQVETLAKMFRYYDRFGYRGNPRILQGLTGRPPGTFAEFVERTIRSNADEALSPV